MAACAAVAQELSNITPNCDAIFLRFVFGHFIFRLNQVIC
jgi:hypothetical protein